MDRPSASRGSTTRTGTIVARPNPVPVADRSALGVTTLEWHASGSGAVEVRVGAPDGQLLSRSGPSGRARTGEWLSDGMVFYLQDAAGGDAAQPGATIATVTVRQRQSLGARVGRRVRGLRGRAGSRGLILLYHRIAAESPDPFGLCVSPDRFAEHLAVVAHGFEVIPLRSVPEGLRTGRLPRRWLALTFDDGYVDNLQVALPLLERDRLPATAFITAGFIGTADPFWSTTLARILLETPHLPSRLTLTLAGLSHEWPLDEAPGGDARPTDRDWRAWHPVAPSARHALLRSLHELLLPLPPMERANALEQVKAWSGVTALPGPSPWLSQDELRRLADGGLVDIGAHSMSHSLLAAQPEAVQREEIEHSKVRIEAWIKRPVLSFAYPYGQRGSFSETTVRLARGAGFAAACAGWPGAVTPATDAYALPRIGVEDVGGEELRRQLDHWWAAE